MTLKNHPKHTKTQLARMIDLTLLKPNATQKDIRSLCEEAAKHRFLNVCVNPYWVEYACKLLSRRNVGVCTVIGFPLGANTSRTKAFEAKEAVRLGAIEVDMVINIGALKSRNRAVVLKDIASVVEAASSVRKTVVKTIIETGLLADGEKVEACRIAEEAGADFVKTCTGFLQGQATVGDVRLMRASVSSRVGVKASGGIRTLQDMEALIQAGANRIGTSRGVEIIQHLGEE